MRNIEFVIIIIFLVAFPSAAIEDCTVNIIYNFNTQTADILTAGGYIDNFEFPMVMVFYDGPRVDIMDGRLNDFPRGVELEIKKDKKKENKYSLSLQVKNGKDRSSRSIGHLHSDDSDDQMLVVTRKSSGEISVSNGAGSFLGNWTPVQ